MAEHVGVTILAIIFNFGSLLLAGIPPLVVKVNEFCYRLLAVPDRIGNLSLRVARQPEIKSLLPEFGLEVLVFPREPIADSAFLDGRPYVYLRIESPAGGGIDKPGVLVSWASSSRPRDFGPYFRLPLLRPRLLRLLGLL